jgi:hypothetical protein
MLREATRAQNRQGITALRSKHLSTLDQVIHSPINLYRTHG